MTCLLCNYSFLPLKLSCLPYIYCLPASTTAVGELGFQSLHSQLHKDRKMTGLSRFTCARPPRVRARPILVIRRSKISWASTTDPRAPRFGLRSNLCKLSLRNDGIAYWRLALRAVRTVTYAHEKRNCVVEGLYVNALTWWVCYPLFRVVSPHQVSSARRWLNSRTWFAVS